MSGFSEQDYNAYELAMTSPLKRTLDYTESFCVLLFAVAVFVWKPGIYVASGLICLYLIVRTSIDGIFQQAMMASMLVKLSLGLYFIGLVTSTFGAENIHDVAWMARKTLFLPVMVFFFFAFQRRINERIAMLGLITSFWVASIVTLWEYDWQFQFGDRMQGTWPLGTWDSLQGLFFPFMVLYICRHRQTLATATLYGLTTAMALIMLLLAGGRAPWLGAFIGLAIYFLIFRRNRKTMLGLASVVVIVGTMSLTVLQDKVQPVIERFSSVTETQTNASNWIRLRLWDIGGQQLVHFAKNNPASFAFGGGALSYDQKQIEFFKTLPYDAVDRMRLQEYGYPTGDTHNTYIDNALRHGVLWTVLSTLYLIWLCTRLNWRYVQRNPEPSILLVGLLVVGMFYTMVPHFATFFFVLFVALVSQKHQDQVNLASTHTTRCLGA